MSAEYDLYIKEHIENLKKGLEWMYENLSDKLINGKKMIEAMMNAEEHDRSKYDKEEYDAYDAYFYGPERTPEVVEAFQKAWLHHQHNNPHHWQHWVLVNDEPNEGVKALEMSDEYIYEMIADWWTFSWRDGNLLEIVNWYLGHAPYMVMAPRTRIVVNDIISAMSTFLRKQMILEHPGRECSEFIFESPRNTELVIMHSDMEEDEHCYGVPELKKFPMPDKRHVKSAIRFFNYIDPKHEKELAEAILERMKEYGMSFEDFGVGDENRFKKYMPKKEQEKE